MDDRKDMTALQDDYEIGKYQTRPKVLHSISLPVMQKLLATFDCTSEMSEVADMPPCLSAKTSFGLTFTVNVLDEDEDFVSRFDQDGAAVVMGANFDLVTQNMQNIDLKDIANRWNSSAFASTACVYDERLSVDYTIPAEGLLSDKFVSLVQEWFQIVNDFVKFVYVECCVGEDD